MIDPFQIKKVEVVVPTWRDITYYRPSSVVKPQLLINAFQVTCVEHRGDREGKRLSELVASRLHVSATAPPTRGIIKRASCLR